MALTKVQSGMLSNGGGDIATNVALGSQALNSNTSGAQNTAIGNQALQANTTSSGNSALGFQAAYTINSADPRITAVGYQALYTCNVANAENTAIGYAAAKFATTGAQLTVVGNEALSSNTSGIRNTGVGYQALVNVTTANNNTALGFRAGYGNTGGGNTFLGYQAGFDTTTGGNFIAIGSDSGKVFTTGTGGLYVGIDTRASAGGAINEFVIGVNAGGSMIGKGNNSGYIVPGGGGVYQSSNSSSWATTSDRRLKKNIVDNNEGLDVISQLRVCNFEYRTPEEITEVPPEQAIQKEGIQLGVIAQELQEVCPGCVREESTGVLSVDSDEIFWHMVNAIKQLNAKVEAQAAEIAALKAAP